MRMTLLRTACGSLGLLALLATGCRTFTAKASTLKPIHLKGLHRVNLIVFVDRDLEGYAGLERDLLVRAQRILADQGISTEGSDMSTLSVEVKTYPVNEHIGANSVLIGVSVQLTEQVRLVRDPSLRFPGRNGAVTWSRESVSIESKTDLRRAVADDVDLSVGSFAADVKGANE